MPVAFSFAKIVNNFKRISRINLKLAQFPLSNEFDTQVDTDKSKSKKFGEVFTPLWLVDQMIGQVNFLNSEFQTLDLCSGYGQFSIRLMRYYFNTFDDFNLNDFIINNHYFSEIQLSSCYKLIEIFSQNINLFIGNCLYLNKIPENAKGIWVFLEKAGKWVCLTKTVNNFSEKFSEEQFVQMMEVLTNTLNEVYISMKSNFEKAILDKNNRLEASNKIEEVFKDLGCS